VSDNTMAGSLRPGVASRPRRAARPTWIAAHRSRLTGLASVIGGIALWEVVARAFFSPLFLPPPSAVWSRALELIRDGTLWEDISASGRSYLLGLLIAIVVGATIGIAMAASRTLRDILDPWVAFLNATPTIALAPLFILILGLGLSSKVAICAIVMLFPILLNTYYGLTGTDAQLEETARSYSARTWQVYWMIKFPMAVPQFVAGLRIAAAHGLVGVVVSELFGARAGIGLLIQESAETFDTAGLFVGICVLGIAGVLVTYALIFAEKRVGKWRPKEGE
jgi:NitT/TauT family transport system permease protein